MATDRDPVTDTGMTQEELDLYTETVLKPVGKMFIDFLASFPSVAPLFEKENNGTDTEDVTKPV